MAEEGPVKIVDAKGVYPENLDKAVAEQSGLDPADDAPKLTQQWFNQATKVDPTGWNLSLLLVDSIWGYKGVPYRIMLTPDANTLIQYNDVWYPCIKYRNAEYNGKTYYRSSREFLEKFNRLS